MDVTVNVIAAKKTELMDGWVKQWQEAVDQGRELQGAGQHAGQPAEHRPVRGRPERDPAEPERERVRLLLPAEPALGRRGVDDQGAAARRRQRLQAELGGVGSRRAPLRQLQHQRGAGRAVARADRDDDAAGGDAVHPDEPGQQALDPGRPRREPVPAVQLLLRPGHVVVPAAARARRRRLPHAAAARGSLAVADRGSRPGHRARDGAGRCTRSTPTRWPGLAMVEPAPRPGRERRARRGRVRLRRRALRHRRRARRRHVGRPEHDRRRRGAVADAGVRARLLPGQPLRARAAEDRRLHRRHDGADEPGVPRNRRRPVHVDRLLRGDLRAHAEGEDPDVADRPAHVDRSRERRARRAAATPC